jgi:hypothetical protein
MYVLLIVVMLTGLHPLMVGSVNLVTMKDLLRLTWKSPQTQHTNVAKLNPQVKNICHKWGF